MQCHPPASSALPIPPAKPETIQQGTAVTGLIPTGFPYAGDVKSLGHNKSLELFLCVPRALCISVETFQVECIGANTS